MQNVKQLNCNICIQFNHNWTKDFWCLLHNRVVKLRSKCKDLELSCSVASNINDCHRFIRSQASWMELSCRHECSIMWSPHEGGDEDSCRYEGSIWRSPRVIMMEPTWWQDLKIFKLSYLFAWLLVCWSLHVGMIMRSPHDSSDEDSYHHQGYAWWIPHTIMRALYDGALMTAKL